MKIIDGDLIESGKQFEFDVIAHSTNCFGRQRKGIAVAMSDTFNTDQFLLEKAGFMGDYDKLGRIDYGVYKEKLPFRDDKKARKLIVVNCYTQYHWKEPSPYGVPVDYDAFTLCMRKLNREFKGLSLGLPYVISCGLAGGDKDKILKILENELVDMEVNLLRKV